MNNQKPKFDPGKPFQMVKEEKPAFDPNKPFEEKTNLDQTDLLESLGAGVSSFANTATFGTLPYLAAGAEEAGELLGVGDKIPYEERVKKAKRFFKEQEEKHPTASALGGLGGVFTGGGLLSKGLSKIPAVGKLFQASEGAGKLARGAKALAAGAAGGGAAGFAQTPEEGFGNIEKRIEQGLEGAKFGAAAVPVVAGLGKVAGIVPGIARKAKDVSDTMALKTAGLNKRMIKDTLKGGSTKELANFIKTAKTPDGIPLMQIGDDVDDILQKANIIKKDAGEKIGQVYENIYNKVSDVDAKKLKMSMLRAISKEAPMIGKEKFKASLLPVVNDITSRPNRLNDVRNIQEMMGNIDDVLYPSNFTEKLSKPAEKGLKEIRNQLRNVLDDKIDEYAKKTGDKITSEAMKKLGKEYGRASDVSFAALDRSSANKANQYFGLSEKLGAIGGGGLGAALSGGPGGILGAAGGALASKLSRTYGPTVGSKGLGLLGEGLEKSSVPLDKLSKLLTRQRPGSVGSSAGLLNANRER